MAEDTPIGYGVTELVSSLFSNDVMQNCLGSGLSLSGLFDIIASRKEQTSLVLELW